MKPTITPDPNPLLAQMQDITLPQEVASWPPAPWVWPVALVILAAVVLLAWRVYRAIHSRRQLLASISAPSNEALNLLESLPLEDDNFVLELSALLKRSALCYYPREQVASLTGEPWVQFLQHTGAPKNTHPGSLAALKLLKHHGYSKVPLSAVERQSLKEAAKVWLKALPGNRPAPEEEAC